MRINRFRTTLNSCISAMILSACAGSQPAVTPGAPGVSIQAQGHRGTGSWMEPNASAQDLLYISGYTSGYVYVYTYPQGQLVGTLHESGFVALYGECTDPAGDVFIIADSSFTKNKPSTIYEYAHGGTNPIAMLTDPNGAVGCAVDPTTDNLAASGGGVAIFKHAAGKPKLYFSSVGLWYCGYDDRGNLYFSGHNDQYLNRAKLYVWPAGSSNLKQISVNTKLYTSQGIEWPSVQWDGKYLTVSSNEASHEPLMIYRLRISGETASVVGTTTLTTLKNIYFGQTWIQGSTIIGVGYAKYGYQDAFLWPYPKGGKPQSAIKRVGDVKQWLWGVAVSLGASR
jgi:WD40 repeat protein